MTKTTKPLENEFISSCSEHFRISKAAELLHCDAEDLLHLGANSKLEILAPVLAEGTYVWDIESANADFPEIVGQVQVHFGGSHRVQLSRGDIATIEARGWVIPKVFYAPSRAKGIDEFLQKCIQEEFLEDGESAELESEALVMLSIKEDGKMMSSVTFSPIQVSNLDSEVIERRKLHYSSAWHITYLPDENTEKTTINNLFISKEELERLKTGGQSNAVEKTERMEIVKLQHGNTERHAKKRESILAAAIFCNKRWPAMCESVPGWVSKIELESERFWPVEKAPPLTRDTITRMLNAAIKGKSSIDKTVE